MNISIFIIYFNFIIIIILDIIIKLIKYTKVNNYLVILYINIYLKLLN